MKRPFLVETRQILDYALSEIKREALRLLEIGQALAIEIGEPNRSLEQNAAQWPILQCWAKQKKWPVNGELVYMTKDEWKDVLTAAFRQEDMRFAKGLNGGMVLLGASTRKFGKKEFGLWLEFLHAASAEHEVELTPAVEDIEPIGRTA